MIMEMPIEEIQKLSLEEIQNLVANHIYKAALVFERLENAGKIKGNGHHIAQTYGEEAKMTIINRWINDSQNSV
jgi:hypothetical protein